MEIRQTELFAHWFSGLRDRQARRRIQARIDRLQTGNPGDVKPVGAGVSELRVDYGPGYRVYFVERGRKLIILLAGGDKRTQQKNITTAIEMARRSMKENAMSKRARVKSAARVRSKEKAALKTTPWNSAQYLKTREDIADYLEAVLEIGDPALLTHALGIIARSKGMAQIAKETGLGRESLYKALSAEGNPEFATVLKVIHALGLKLKVAA